MNFKAFTGMSIRCTLQLAAVAALLGFMGSCNVINPAEVVPTYVEVDSFAFEGNTGITGSNSHRISSVFTTLNSQSIGAYDLPVTFPVIMDNPGKMMFTAGVNYNGMYSYQVQYPFYLSDTITVSPNATPGATLHVTPKIRYNPLVKFSYMQDFENFVAAPFVDFGGDTTMVAASGSDAFEGKYGLITLTSIQDSSVNITRDPFELPVNTDLYLEMDYKSNVPINVGMQTTFAGNVVRSYIIGLNPRETWGKVYIDLRTFVSTYQGGYYQLILRSVRTSDVSEGRTMFDNLKIVHF